MKCNLLGHYVASTGGMNEVSDDAKQKLQGLCFQEEHRTSFQLSQYHHREERLSTLGVISNLQSFDLAFLLLQRTLYMHFPAKVTVSQV